MKTVPLRWSDRLSTLAAVACLGVASGCGTFAPHQETLLPARHEYSGVIIDRTYDVRQVGTGENAHFARCVQPACPRVTPKTVAAIGLASHEQAHVSTAMATAPVRAGRPPVETAIVHFATGSAGLDQRAQATLTQFAAVAREAQRIVVSGRTDSTGSDEVNRRLAHARAQAVATYLHRKSGATRSHIEFDAQGRCCYAAANEAEAGRQLNRRAEVSFYQAPRSAQ